MPVDLFAAIAETARVELSKTLRRIDNGARMLVNGRLYDFEPQPSDVLIDERHLLLRRYRRPEGVAQRHPVPVLIVPPLMVKPDIFDLRPGHSLVEFLLEAGFDVWLVDFGRPDARDRDFRLEDYLLHPINTSVETMREVTGSRQVSMFGYCMGGVFATIYAALETTDAVRNVVMIGAPFDYEKLGIYHTIASYTAGTLVSLTELLGYFPAVLSQTFFQISTPTKLAARPFTLVWNLWDEDYLESYEAMNKWMTDFLHYPEAAFKQFAREIVVGNKLLKNELEMFGRRVDLSKITAACLVLASPDDHFGPPEAARPILDVVASDDKTFMLVRGGHAGAVAGSRAPANWRLVADWLAERSGTRVEPAPPGAAC